MGTDDSVLKKSPDAGGADEYAPLLLRAIECKSRNSCATKSTAALGMIDVALLSANASQLKYVLRLGTTTEFYSIMVGLILASIIIQALAFFINLILCSLYNIDKSEQANGARNCNNTVLGLDAIITIINVVITAFDVQQGYGAASVGQNLPP